ncbi:hypothetical protein RRF57_008535 [Xylaria bambusicola]|uniref:Uncharacterized protein n=1 Tax=Xylaria bambusicola TaxID=326684 RepID=A0AAN7UU28_9PEZI
MLNAGASLLVLFADVAEDVTVIFHVKILSRCARKGFEHAIAEVAVRGGRKGLSDLPVLSNTGASSRRVGGLIGTHGGGGGVDGGKLAPEDIVVFKRLDLVTSDLGNTIVILFLMEHVNDTAAKHTSHFVRVEGSSIIPKAAFSTTNRVATVLSEENGDRVVGEEFDLDVVARLLVATLAAP